MAGNAGCQAIQDANTGFEINRLGTNYLNMVAVADLVMRRTVNAVYVGASPIGYPIILSKNLLDLVE